MNHKALLCYIRALILNYRPGVYKQNSRKLTKTSPLIAKRLNSRKGNRNCTTLSLKADTLDIAGACSWRHPKGNDSAGKEH